MSAQLLAQLEAAFAAGDKTKCQQLLTNLKVCGFVRQRSNEQHDPVGVVVIWLG